MGIGIEPLDSAKSLLHESGLADCLKDVDSLQRKADVQVERLMASEAQGLQGERVMSEAEDTFRLMMQIRAKLTDAYQRLMSMQ